MTGAPLLPSSESLRVVLAEGGVGRRGSFGVFVTAVTGGRGGFVTGGRGGFATLAEGGSGGLDFTREPSLPMSRDWALDFSSASRALRAAEEGLRGNGSIVAVAIIQYTLLCFH